MIDDGATHLDVGVADPTARGLYEALGWSQAGPGEASSSFIRRHGGRALSRQALAETAASRGVAGGA
jgi:hypothetical protein